MAQPTRDTAIQRPDLGTLVFEHMQTSGNLGFIGLQVMPLFPVPEQSAGYPVIPKEALLKIPDTKRAMRGAYGRSDWEWEEGHYATKEHGWEEPIDDRERKLYQDKFDHDVVCTMRAVDIILRSQEKRVASKVFNATNFTAHPVANEWDDAATATPINDVNAGKNAIREASGMLANALLIAYSTMMNLRECDQIVERLKYTFPGMDINAMGAAELARIFDVERVLVGGAVYDSAKKGQDASISDLWDNEYAMLTRVSEANNVLEPCLGRTFLWTEDSDSNSVVEEYREEQTRGDVIRVRHDVDEACIKSFDEDGNVKSNISAAVSYLFSNITT